jgi:hypothetical protein
VQFTIIGAQDARHLLPHPASPAGGLRPTSVEGERKVLDSILVICPAGYFVAPLVVVFGGKSPAQ